MAGFLRKKSSSDSKSTKKLSRPVQPSSPHPLTASTPSSVPPLYARFTSGQSNQPGTSPDTSRRLISSPAPLANGRKLEARGGHAHGTSDGVRRTDERNYEVQGRTQPISGPPVASSRYGYNSTPQMPNNVLPSRHTVTDKPLPTGPEAWGPGTSSAHRTPSVRAVQPMRTHEKPLPQLASHLARPSIRHTNGVQPPHSGYGNSSPAQLPRGLAAPDPTPFAPKTSPAYAPLRPAQSYTTPKTPFQPAQDRLNSHNHTHLASPPRHQPISVNDYPSPHSRQTPHLPPHHGHLASNPHLTSGDTSRPVSNSNIHTKMHADSLLAAAGLVGEDSYMESRMTFPRPDSISSLPPEVPSKDLDLVKPTSFSSMPRSSLHASKGPRSTPPIETSGNSSQHNRRPTFDVAPSSKPPLVQHTKKLSAPESQRFSPQSVPIADYPVPQSTRSMSPYKSEVTTPDLQLPSNPGPQPQPTFPMRKGPLIFAAMISTQVDDQVSLSNKSDFTSASGRDYGQPPATSYPSPPTEYNPLAPRNDFETPHSAPAALRSSDREEYNHQTPSPGSRSIPEDIPEQRQRPNLSPVPPVQPRLRKVSKSGTSIRSFHTSHTPPPSATPESPAKSPGTPRLLTKTRPITPVSPEKPLPQQPSPPLDPARDGLPLDDDPFAKVEGVRILKPRSREDLRTPSRAGTIKSVKPPSRDGTVETDIEARASPPKMTTLPPSPPSPPTPDEYRHARSRRRGTKLEKTPPPFVADIVPRQSIVAPLKEPTFFPLATFLATAKLLSCFLEYMTFWDWCMLSSISKEIRNALQEKPDLREAILERYLSTIGYTRWDWEEQEPLSLSLKDLNDYMHGVSIPTHQYNRSAESFLQTLSLHRLDPQAQAQADVARSLRAATRAYTRVVLRLRAQAESEQAHAPPPPDPLPHLPHRAHPPSSSRNWSRGNLSRASSRAPSPTQSLFSHAHDHSISHGNGIGGGTISRAWSSMGRYGPGSRSPLFRLRRSPLLRVFVPSPEGDWLSDSSVFDCEAELRKAGVLELLRPGDVVWDVAAGDEGNVGRLVWDGSYLIDLDYTYSATGDLPKYLHALAFSPSYFHRVIRTGPSGKGNENGGNPVVRIDISPWGDEIAANLQLLQDRVRTETPQGGKHNVVRWVHRSSFQIQPSTSARSGSRPTLRVPILHTELFVDPAWYGRIIVEAEGTNEGLADLQMRCGAGVFPPRLDAREGAKEMDSRMVYRVLREKSRPGEIWIRTVREKERLL